jgi:hypothetical protein
MSNLVFLVDDSAREREKVTADLQQFVPGTEVITASKPREAIEMLTDEFLMRLHAAILDHQLDEYDHATHSRKIYAKMLQVDGRFAGERVALRTSHSEEFARRRFAEDSIPFPPKYLGKGRIRDMVEWVKGLSSRELLTPQHLAQWIVALAAESRDTHECPDFSSKAAEIAQAVYAIAQGHPALREENRHLQSEFNTLCMDILRLLDERIPQSDFPDSVRWKRRFMLNSWAGILANRLVNHQ